MSEWIEVFSRWFAYEVHWTDIAGLEIAIVLCALVAMYIHYKIKSDCWPVSSVEAIVKKIMEDQKAQGLEEIRKAREELEIEREKFRQEQIKARQSGTIINISKSKAKSGWPKVPPSN